VIKSGQGPRAPVELGEIVDNFGVDRNGDGASTS